MQLPKVSICCFDDGHIVPRMMGWLEDALGWPVISGYDPDPEAVNYLAPYTMIGRYGPPPGLSMAWFTHFEEGNLPKMGLWHRATREIDLPLITAPVYAGNFAAEAYLHEKPTRPFFKLTPGVDQEYFKPGKKKRPGKGVIGLVGVPSDRKGTEAASQLVASLTKGKKTAVSQVLAVGGEWPDVPGSKLIPYEEMPAFYDQLDLLVCTSTIEGIPAPPLEALACGVPVVVPQGVGIMDELAAGPAVWHFTPGDTKKLTEAILEALEGSSEVSKNEARAVVADYTVEAWCLSHQLALEALVAGGLDHG